MYSNQLLKSDERCVVNEDEEGDGKEVSCACFTFFLPCAHGHQAIIHGAPSETAYAIQRSYVSCERLAMFLDTFNRTMASHVYATYGARIREIPGLISDSRWLDDSNVEA